MGGSLFTCGVLLAFIRVSSERHTCVTVGTTVNCTSKGLTEVPNYIPQPATELDLSHNNIEIVSFINTSHPLSLKKLYLSNNKIATLVRGVLDAFENLQELDLSYNQISGSSLLIETFKYEIGHFKSLQRLNLKGNHLGTLERLTFTAYGFSTLERLDLSHCSLSTLEHLSIDNLSRLKYLDLSYNDLETFDALSLEGLTELETLSLSHNKLAVLREIPRSISLKELYIDHNNLVSVKENILHMVLHLEILSLKGNKMKSLQPHVLPLESGSVREIRLDDNPWRCDCNVKWLVEQKSQLTFRNFTLRCEFPGRLRHKNIFDIPAEDLVCSSVHSRVIFTIMLLFSTVLLVTMAVLAIYHNRKICSCFDKRGSTDSVIYSKVNNQAGHEGHPDQDTHNEDYPDITDEGDYLIKHEVLPSSDVGHADSDV